MPNLAVFQYYFSTAKKEILIYVLEQMFDIFRNTLDLHAKVYMNKLIPLLIVVSVFPCNPKCVKMVKSLTLNVTLLIYLLLCIIPDRR